MNVFAKADHILLVQEKPNPSTDYYLEPRIRASGKPCRVLTGDELPAAAELTGACVVFVRYIPPGWAPLVRRHAEKLAGIVYFMDDDLFDLAATQHLRMRYRWHLANRATRYQQFLKRHGALLWVSTHYLQQKYASWKPLWLDPLPLALPTAGDEHISVFYHGSVVTHRDDIEWLVPVMQRVLAADPRIHFEVVGNAALNRRIKALPRTVILHSLPWHNYLDFCRLYRRDIGLAPLLPGPFNAARSPVKFFDITRCGAAGLYADAPPFDTFVHDGKDGVLLPVGDADAWAEGILALAADDKRRTSLYRQAEARLAQLARHPEAADHPSPGARRR